jgi:hypothetical protein
MLLRELHLTTRTAPIDLDLTPWKAPAPLTVADYDLRAAKQKAVNAEMEFYCWCGIGLFLLVAFFGLRR